MSLLTTFPFLSDLGAHIDGFIAVAAHTVVVDASADEKITGRQADVILAAYWAVQAALRLLKSGSSVSFDLVEDYPVQETDCQAYYTQRLHISTLAKIIGGNWRRESLYPGLCYC